MRTVDVVIAGAGPAGSATAALLAAAGVRVLLTDRSPFPRPKPCAEYLSPEAGRILDRLGVLDAVSQDAARLTGMRIVSPGGIAFVGRFRPLGDATPFRPWGLALPRERLDGILANAAAARGADFRPGTALESFAAGPTGVVVQLRAGATREAVHAAILVGADGLRSRIARALGVARGADRHRTAFVTHAESVSGMGDVGEMHVFAGGYVGLADVGGGITNIAAVVDRARMPAGSGTRQRLEALLDRVPAVRGRLAGARFVSPVRAVGPFARSTTRATADAVALVGDAADFYDPFTGEGIFAALRGAELLAPHVCRALEHGTLRAADLAPYDRDRRRAFAGKWWLERAIGAVVARPALLDHVAERLARRPAVADLLVGATGDFVPARRVFRPSVVWRMVA
ncbi:MAG: NAD(P)/FAD-dependent oxidoreductase [Gemmatimonadota bacterium]|nr:NAD(P)/FAD-dependent oxidoreductase [Gemmatimonadota bacterium]MDH4350105.1 NAD(P)/FAD-dependent oxidoreductase [Gemmatimonadota bacterium]MDH5195845.1 NAD(P)/FAD-dependent oxidoreductase [Gemmatimonadota bacterium]